MPAEDMEPIETLLPEHFQTWRKRIKERIGLKIGEDQIGFLERRLKSRLRTLALTSYEQYEQVLASGKGKREWEELVDLLVNQQSGFFRHRPSYTAFMNSVLPERIDRQTALKNGQRLSIASVGCAKGQEAYSLAMATDRVMEENRFVDYEVTGVDISKKALEQAKQAEYSHYEIKGLPDEYKSRYLESFLPYKNGSLQVENREDRHLRYRVREDIKKRTTFARYNLAGSKSLNTHKKDVIFCQNLFIYFDQTDRIRFLKKLLNTLKPGGYLFLAPGEIVGVKVTGAVTIPFKDTLTYKRNKEEADVRLGR
jgi:chemotaxis protein methyltransferase CheR